MRAPRASIAKKVISQAFQPALTSSMTGMRLSRAKIAKIKSKNFGIDFVSGVVFLIVLIRLLKNIPAITLVVAAKISTNNHPATCMRQLIKMFKDAILV